MKQLRKRILSFITAAAVAFSAVTLPDMGILPNMAITASAEYYEMSEPIYINSSNKSQYDGKLFTGTFTKYETDSCFDPAPLNNGYMNGAIIIDGVMIDLRISDLAINIIGTNSSGRNISGIYLANGATLNLILDGSSNSSNIIKACGDGAGICVTNGCTLNITSLVTNGKLTVYGGRSSNGDNDTASYGGAGIGAEGASNTGLGTINISSGTIEAYGGSTGTGKVFGAAAIGGSVSSGLAQDYQGNITISGGTVNATAYYGNAAIGGAYGHAVESITISGGNVTADSSGGASIGCGKSRYAEQYLSCGTLNITGGTVTTNRNIGYGDEGLGKYSGGSISIGENATINCGGNIIGGDHTYHKISFDANGGTGTKKPIYVAEGSYTLPSCSFTAPSGKKFSKWNLGNAGTTVQITGDTVLQAQWAQIVTVRFDANGGTGTMEDVESNVGASYRMPACGFTPPEGKEFLWWQKVDSNTKWYQGDVITLYNDVTFQAIWKVKDPPAVTWNNETVNITEDTEYTRRTEVIGNVTLNIAKGVTLTAKGGIHVPEGSSLTISGEGTLLVNDVGWKTSGIGANETDTCGTVTINSGIVNVTGGEYATGIGAYNGSCGTININGGIVNVSGTYAIGSASISGGGNINICGGQVTATATGSINGAIGKQSETVTLSWTNPSDFIKVNYYNSNVANKTTFSKDFVFENTGGDATKDNIKSIGWKIVPKGIYVIFDMQGHGTAINSQTITSGNTATKPSDPSEAGYEFGGWFTDSDCTSEFDFNTAITGRTVLYAKWTAIAATAPTITTQPADLELAGGAYSGNMLTVAADSITGHELSYQWYSNTENNTTGGTAIGGATEASFSVPTDTDGTKYYYCIVTATRTDNKQTATATSNAAKVTVITKTDAGLSIDAGSFLNKTYGDEAFTLTGAVTNEGDNAVWTWTSDAPDVAAITSGGTTATPTITIYKASDTPVTIIAKYDSKTTTGITALTLNVGKAPVTITGLSVSDKTYDGTTDATITGTAAINGVVGSDDVTVTVGTAKFDNKNVGTGKAVTFSGFSLSGTAAGNYTLSAQPASVTANITEKEVMVSGITASNKEYNGTTDAELDCSGATFTGKLESDTLTVTATGAFADENAGTGKTVTISGLTLGGADAGNYVLAASGQQETATANITKKAVTITAKAQSVEVGGTISSLVTDAELTGALDGHTLITVTLTADSAASVGAHTITPSNAKIQSGTTDVTENYAITYTVGTLTVTNVQVYISGVTASNKIYDGAASATITGTAILKKVSDDTVVSGLNVSGITAAFADKNVGSGKTVTISAATLSDTTNYTLLLDKTNEKLSLTANITAKEVTISGITASDKEYDGNTDATLIYTDATLTGKLDDDDLTVTATGAFADANVGENKTVNISGLTLGGADAGNYVLAATEQQTSTTADITKAAHDNATVSGSAKYGKSGSVDLSALIETGGTAAVTDTTDANNVLEGTPSVSGKLLTFAFVDDNNKVGNTATVTINVESGNYNDYTITATLMVSNRDVPVLTVQNITKTYDGTAITASAISGTAKVGSDTITGSWSFEDDTPIKDAADSGARTVVFTPDDTGSYDTVTTTITVTINRKAVTVKADNKTRTTEESDPTLTATVTGLVGSDTVNYTLSRAAGDTVGTYTITPSGDTVQGNYAVTYQTGTLTITAGTIAVTGVSLNKSSTTLEVGASETLTATVLPTDATDKTVIWSSSDPSVATVSGGTVNTIKAGTTIITATAGSKSATCTITVKDIVIAVTGITLNKSSTTLIVGGSETLVATVTPDNATDKNVTWTTSDRNVVVVANGTISATGVGTATITAKAGDKTATCTVTVRSSGGGGNGGGGYTPVIPSGGNDNNNNNTNTDKNNDEPKIEGGSGASGWKNIISEIGKTPEGGTVTIDMNGTTKLPKDVISSIKGKDVNIVLDMGGGVSWTINGKDVTSATGNIDMGVTVGKSGIPVDVINNITGEKYSIVISLAHNGDFGFTATLTIGMRKQDAGLYANLFYYNTKTKELEFVCSGKIREDGSVDLEFTHASDYTIVVDDHPLGGRDVTAKTNGHKVKLTWDAIPEAESYKIYYKKNGKYKKLTTVSGTALTVTGLKNGKEYEFLIRYSVDGKLSEIAESYKISVTAYYKPAPKLTAGKGYIRITWDKVEDATAYRVYKYVNGKLKLLTEVKDLAAIRLTNTKSGKEYTFAVKAYVNGEWTKVYTSDLVSITAK